MGKRKLNGTSFYQCDWTGYPMKQPFCYMPEWTANDKLQKKGSYCNWESVAAHATFLLQKNQMTEEKYNRIKEHILTVCGAVVEDAPHYEELSHTKGRMNVFQFHEHCTAFRHPVCAVKITPNGDVFEVILTPDSLYRVEFANYLHKPYNFHCAPSCFHSMRKKGQKGPDRDLTVWYYGVKELPHNPTASNLFKMQLYGDVLLVQQSRESSFMTRERYVNFTKSLFDEQFNKKRKRQADVHSMAPSVYAEVKEAMQKQLNQFEEHQSQHAVRPNEMSRIQKGVPSVGGKALAVAARARVEAAGVPFAIPSHFLQDPPMVQTGC